MDCELFTLTTAARSLPREAATATPRGSRKYSLTSLEPLASCSSTSHVEHGGLLPYALLARPVGLSLAQIGGQVLQADLNCSESS
jgi:hypothetical protein